jgi:hypothetical protein
VADGVDPRRQVEPAAAAVAADLDQPLVGDRVAGVAARGEVVDAAGRHHPGSGVALAAAAGLVGGLGGAVDLAAVEGVVDSDPARRRTVARLARHPGAHRHPGAREPRGVVAAQAQAVALDRPHPEGGGDLLRPLALVQLLAVGLVEPGVGGALPHLVLEVVALGAGLGTDRGGRVDRRPEGGLSGGGTRRDDEPHGGEPDGAEDRRPAAGGR